jgi:dolichol-phosphate mannosyltransferase
MVNVVLPAYNEEAALPPLFQSLDAALAGTASGYRVIVVDDGSSDATAQVAEEAAKTLPVVLVKHGVNKGLGAAINTGLREAVARCGEGDVVVAMDADNTHTPGLIPQMERAVLAGSDVVIASRYAPGGEEIGLAPHRKVFSRCASLLLRTFFPVRGARDYTCGYRAYSPAFLQKAFDAYGDKFVQETGFVCMAEILIKLGALGARVSEEPLVLRYDLKGSPSKMKVMRTISRYFRLIAHRGEMRPPGSAGGAA